MDEDLLQDILDAAELGRPLGRMDEALPVPAGLAGSFQAAKAEQIKKPDMLGEVRRAIPPAAWSKGDKE